MLTTYKTTVEKQIDWYFNCSQADMGISSNWYAMINASSTTPSDPPDSVIHYLPAIRKHRKIHNALQALTAEEFRYFCAIYQEDYQSKYPRMIKLAFTEKTGLVLCLYQGKPEKLLDLCSKYRHSSLSPEETAIFNELQARTSILYHNIHQKINQHLKRK